MAVITRPMASDAGGLCRVSVDVDPALNPVPVLAVRVTNASDKNYLVWIAARNGSQRADVVFSPNGGVERVFAITGNQQTRYGVTVNAKGTVEANFGTSWPTDLPATPGL